MQNWFPVVLGLFLSPFWAIAQEPRTISVSAQSEIRVVPDEAIIEFSVVVEDEESLTTAKTENDGTSAKVAKAVNAEVMAPDQFKVTSLFVGPRYHRDNSRVRDGYRVSRTFAIFVTDFSRVDPLIAALVDAGGDRIQINTLKLQVRDQRKHLTEARRLAVEYARAKATQLAELNQMRLGNAITIHENVQHNEHGGGFGGFGGGLGGLGANNADNPLLAEHKEALSLRPNHQFIAFEDDALKPRDPDKEKDAAILLSPGQVSLNATVTITFELLPK